MSIFSVNFNINYKYIRVQNKLILFCYIKKKKKYIDNWFQEFERWCPTIKVEKYHGSLDEKRYWRTMWTKHGFGDIDVILTTYV